MNHDDHVNLLRDGVPGRGGVWADFGSGSGAFTLALAELIGVAGQIFSVDKDAGALKEQQRAMRAQFPGVLTRYLTGDFTQRQDLPPLDGIVMANALHFVKDKGPVLKLMRGYLKPGGRFILVEYNADSGNTWVPHPLSYETWETLAGKHGFSDTRLLARYPSRFLREMFSALSLK